MLPSVWRIRDHIVKSEDRELNRREFNGLWTTLGPSLLAVGAIASLSSTSTLNAATSLTSNDAGRTVKFRDGAVVPALGQGSWHLGKGRHPGALEEEALRTGISLGMTLIDTAEVYSNGHSEELIGRAIVGLRDRVFIVSKVWQTHTAGNGIARACEASLARLGTDHLDLYLLHFPNGVTDLAGVVTAFEGVRLGKFAPGAFPTSRSATWNACSIFHKVIAVRLIRSATTSATAALNMNCYRGASGTACL